MSRPLPIAVLISGGGRSLLNLIERFSAEGSPVRIVGVIASRRDAGGLAYARDAGIPTEVIRRRDHVDDEAFSTANSAAIRAFGAELVVMAGYLSYYRLPEDLAGRAINIHPSLLPLFGGKGFYGHHVHEAVLTSGMRVSGCTVHFVDNEYDQGPVVLQLACPVEPNDDADVLAARVFGLEKIALPTAIEWIAGGAVRWEAGRAVFAAGLTMPWRPDFEG
ncbi:MAG: phosphoribosylglycinamide formyltransferase [Planctomycetes bacterium]|nr:phosphoribosylglycinamide formyltransferase [Planctomycetota bacterium]